PTVYALPVWQQSVDKPCELFNRSSSRCGKIAHVNIVGNLGAHVDLAKAEDGALLRHVDHGAQVRPDVPDAVFPSFRNNVLAYAGIFGDQADGLVRILDVEVERPRVGLEKPHRQVPVLEEIGIGGKDLVSGAVLFGFADVATPRIITV